MRHGSNGTVGAGRPGYESLLSKGLALAVLLEVAELRRAYRRKGLAARSPLQG
jgi:hypothetical protein